LKRCHLSRRLLLRGCQPCCRLLPADLADLQRRRPRIQLLLRQAKRGFNSSVATFSRASVSCCAACQLGVLRRDIRQSLLLSGQFAAQCVAPDNPPIPKSIATAIAANSAPEFVLGVS
jgi:hypothetical protein